MPDTIVDEPQYQQAIAGVQGMLAGGVPRRVDPDEQDEYYDSIKEMLVRQGLEESAPKKAEKKGFNPLALIPGYAQGLMQRQAYDQKNELLKLEQQRQKGIAADRQLKLRQQLEEIRLKREERAQRKTLGTAVRLLQEGGLDEQSQRELQGQIGQGVAQIGDAGDILRAQEGAQEQAAQRAIAGLGGEEPGQEPSAATTPQRRAPGSDAGLPASYRNLDPPTRKRIDVAVATAARQTGLDPAEIYGLMGAESNFDPDARSPVGAIGLMQLMPGTARDLQVDPNSIEGNILGGAMYYARLKQRFRGNVQLARAAYNAGPGAVDKYGGVPPYAETEQHGERTARMEARFAGPGAVAPAQADTPALAQDRGRLRVLEARLGMLSQRRARLLPLAHTKAGKAAYDNVQQDYTQTVSEINALRTRLYEQGPEKFERDLQRARQTGLEGAQTAAERTRLVEEAKTQAERTRTLGEVEKDRATLYRDKTTGEPLDITTPYAAALEAAKPNGPAVVFTKKQEDRWNEVEAVLPVVTELRDAVERVYGPGGIFENLAPEDRAAAAVRGGYARFTQTNPDLAELGRLIESNVDLVRRGLQGVVGTLTEQDAVRGTGAFAKTKGIPDSQAVAYALTNAFQTMIERGQARMLRNPAYKNPALRLLENPPQAQGSPLTVEAVEAMSPAQVKKTVEELTPETFDTIPLEAARALQRRLQSGK